MQGHESIVKMLTNKWLKEKHYRLRKELFAFTDNKVSLASKIYLEELADEGSVDRSAVLV
jgi:nuclear transport factor 2 (NTF2) superfamily protein